MIYIALPAGLFLLGISRQFLQKKAAKSVVVGFIAFIGVLSHEEFYFFIIVTSIVLLIFRIKQANYVYAGIISALFAIFVVNYVVPQNYYASTEVFGIPLLYLGIFFVSACWTIDIGLHNVQIIKRILRMGPARKKEARHLCRSEPIARALTSNGRISFLIRLIIVSVFVSVYISSFIILAPLSLHNVNDEALRGGVPWYQYPMKLGLMGLLGVAFILCNV